MTVSEWIGARRPAAPSALALEVAALLGAEGDRPAGETADVCLRAAAHALEQLVAERRFERESALRLLAVDALTTYAFEHVSGTARSVEEMEAMARRGSHLFGEIAGG